MLAKGELQDVDVLRHPSCIGVSTMFVEGEGVAPLPCHNPTKADFGQLQEFLVVSSGDVSEFSGRRRSSRKVRRGATEDR